MEENEINDKDSNDLEEEENNHSENNFENNNFYQDFINDEENYYENKKIKEEQKRKNEIRGFYFSILELLTKKQYKKILELFVSKEEEKEEEKENDERKTTYQTEWIFPYLHIISIERVIQNKVNKYNKSININVFKRYLEKENKILNQWLQLINELIINHKRKKEDIQCFLEFTIEFILSKCLFLSKYCIYHQNIKEAIYFLSLGIYLINHTYNFIKSPRTFCISGELLIYLTSILIADNKYESAKNLINFSIKLLYLGLEIIVFSNSEQLSYTFFDILSQEKQIIEPIVRIIFLISISFYHLGVSYENQGNNYNAFFAYKQSKFFLSIIKDIDEEIFTFYEFIINVENRQQMRNRLIFFYKKSFKKEKLIEEEKPKIKVYNAFIRNKEKKEKKFLNLEEYISNMNLIEADNEDPHLFDKVDKVFKPNVNMATKQIHLLDYLMSDDFKNIINNMKKIRINKLDYETMHIIQRQIINIKNNQREKLSKLYKKKLNNKSEDKTNNSKNLLNKRIKTASSSKTFNSGKKTRVSSGYKNSQTIFTDTNKSESFFFLNSRPSTAQNDRLKRHKKHKSKYHFINNLPKRSLTMNNVNNDIILDFDNQKKQSLLFSYRCDKNNSKNSIPKYSYDKFLFKKSFIKKQKNLEKQYDNELDFQKKFLRCKEKEKTKPPPFNLKQVQTECEKFYFSTFDKEMMKIKEKKFIVGADYLKNIVRRKFNSINDNNTIKDLRQNKKFIQLFNNNNNKEDDVKNIDDNNYKYINTLMREIDFINKKEKTLIKNYRKKKNLSLQIN